MMERFEIRCTPEIRELAEAIRDIEGHTTFSTMIRTMLVEHARELALHPCGNRRVEKILMRISKGSS